MRDRCRLDPIVVGAIERELRGLRAMRARAERLEAEAGAVPVLRGVDGAVEVRRERRAGDPVARVAAERERLLEQAQDLRRRIRRVEIALEALPPDQRRVAEGYYVEGRPRVEIEAELNVSTKTFWRLRNRALETVAYVLLGVTVEEAAG